MFGFHNTKEEKAEALSPYLSIKEVRKIEKTIFTDTQASPKQIWFLGFAAPLLAKENQPVDAFPSYKGRARERISSIYLKNWGDDSPQQYQKEFTRLLEEGLFQELNPVYEVLTKYPPEQWDAVASRITKADSHQLDKLASMSRVFEMNEKYGIPSPKSGIKAFDIARAANLTAVAFALSYIGQKEAEERLFACAELAAEYYSDWREYLGGYALGRSVFAWQTERYLLMDAPAVRNICRILLLSPNSPYQKVKIDFGLK